MMVSDRLANNQHQYGCDIPGEVLVLTAQAVSLADRVEVEVSGWGLGLERWGIQYLVIPGTMADESTRERITALLGQVWIREDGERMMIARYVHDSGGLDTDHVYDFVGRYGQAFAVRESMNYHSPFVGRCVTVQYRSHHLPVFILGINDGQMMVDNCLNIIQPGPWCCHWPLDMYLSDGITPRGYDGEYFHYLTQDQSRGFVQSYNLMVYGLAAILIYGGKSALEIIAKKRGG